jgi:hypothetical protein
MSLSTKMHRLLLHLVITLRTSNGGGSLNSGCRHDTTCATLRSGQVAPALSTACGWPVQPADLLGTGPVAWW